MRIPTVREFKLALWISAATGAVLLALFFWFTPRTTKLTGEEVLPAGARGGPAWCAFSPDGRKLVVSRGRVDGEVILFDLVTKKQTTLFPDISGGYLSVAFSGDGKWVAVACWSGPVLLWDVTAGKCAGVLEGHDSAIFSLQFAPDSSVLASGGHDGKIVVWDMKTRRPKFTRVEKKAIKALVFTPDGSAIIYAVSDSVVARWEPVKDRTRTLVEEPRTRDGLAIFPDGKLFVHSTYHVPVGIHATNTGEEKLTFTPKSKKPRTTIVTPDGQFLLFGCGQQRTTSAGPGYVELWKSDGRYVTRFEANALPVMSLALARDGKTLATGDTGGGVKLWDISSILNGSD